MIIERFLASAEVMQVLSEQAFVQAMLDFEAALARALESVGALPAGVGDRVAASCRADRFDIDALVEEGTRAGTLVIPLVKQLTAAVAAHSPEAALYVHWGATSQDVLDTAQVLVTRRALALIDRDLSLLIERLLRLADRHGQAPLLGRTLMQPAQVISFGFKLAGWIAPLLRAQARLRSAGQSALQLQLGGAVGTLASMEPHGDAVIAYMAQHLQLRAPAATWHTQRDEWTALACEAGLLAGSLGKIAKDVSLMAQAEVGELAEPSGPGRGGSSAMPHKRNPVASMIALSAALRAPLQVAALLAAMPQEHERGLGNWQAEGAEGNALFAAVHGALSAFVEPGDHWQINPDRMLANIDALRGLVFAEGLTMRAAQVIGKSAAHHWVEQLAREAVASGAHLREVAAAALPEEPRLSAALSREELLALFDVTRPAANATRRVRPQLAALAEQAEAQRRSAPWQAWLPEDKQP